MPRVGVLATLVGALLFTPAARPHTVHACTPSGLTVRFLAPVGEEPIPTHAVFWFELSGVSLYLNDFSINPEITDPNGAAVPVLVSAPFVTSSRGGSRSSDRRIRAEADLEPNTSYTLSYSTPPPGYSNDGPTRVTRNFVTGPSVERAPPASPTAELAFADADDDERLPSPCTDGEYHEVTIIMAKAPGARAIHARLRYADETEFGHAITHVLQPSESGDTMFAWAEDRGIPCVQLVAEGPDGRESEPTVLCEPVGCVEGEEWFGALGRSAEWWRDEHGPGSCSGVESADPSRGCACVAVDDTHVGSIGVIAGLMVLLVMPRRHSGNSGKVERPSISPRAR